jgi:hypothetical protein
VSSSSNQLNLSGDEASPLPYLVWITWRELVLYSAVILLLSTVLVADRSNPLRFADHPVVFSVCLLFLILTAVVLASRLIKSIKFVPAEIRYRFVFNSRRYSYEALRTVQRVSRRHFMVKFTFSDGLGFNVDPDMMDLNRLIDIFRSRSPVGYTGLTTLRVSN